MGREVAYAIRGGESYGGGGGNSRREKIWVRPLKNSDAKSKRGVGGGGRGVHSIERGRKRGGKRPRRGQNIGRAFWYEKPEQGWNTNHGFGGEIIGISGKKKNRIVGRK